MKWGMVIASVGLVVGASVAWAKPHGPANASFVAVAGGATCPAGTTELYAGTSVVFKNPNNGNLTEDVRCWQSPPSSTADVSVVVLGSCVVCRFGS